MPMKQHQTPKCTYHWGKRELRTYPAHTLHIHTFARTYPSIVEPIAHIPRTYPRCMRTYPHIPHSMHRKCCKKWCARTAHIPTHAYASAVHRIMPIPCTYPHIPHPTKYNENVVAIVRTYHNTHDLGYHIQSSCSMCKNQRYSVTFIVEACFVCRVQSACEHIRGHSQARTKPPVLCFAMAMKQAMNRWRRVQKSS